MELHGGSTQLWSCIKEEFNSGAVQWLRTSMVELCGVGV